MPGISHWQHPSFFGYFPSNGSLGSVLGDYVSTGLGVLGLAWQSSPALTELEEVVTGWLRQMVGLSPAWNGVIQDTASTSTLVALLCARERRTNYGLVRGGLQAEPQAAGRLHLGAGHSSVEKAALLAGFGRENVRMVACDARYGMRTDALAAAIAEDGAAGRVPCAVVATTGTTTTTALDPVDEIARVVAGTGIWLHVDAAMAGSAMMLPECRWMWEGVEAADSLVLNPHKWLGAAFDCSLYYVRDAAASGPRDVHQSQLPADRCRRPGEELPRLGHPARPAVPRAEAVVPDPRAGRPRAAGAAAARSRQRPLARRRSVEHTPAGGCWRRCRCRRCACGTSRPG